MAEIGEAPVFRPGSCHECEAAVDARPSLLASGGVTTWCACVRYVEARRG
jgi:hypothetical protein